MGSIFKHVEDHALRTCAGTQCHQCERSNVPIYDYFGEIIDPKLAADPGLAEQEPGVEELCADCINGSNVRRRDTYEAERLISEFADDTVSAWDEFHRLPTVPLLLQGFDWPLCCGCWTDFEGSPVDYSDLLRIQSTAQAWRCGPINQRRDFESLGPPERFDEVSLFACSRAGGDTIRTRLRSVHL